jgi:protein O-GlcNAc transferase
MGSGAHDAGAAALREAFLAWQRGDTAAAEALCRRAIAQGVDDARADLLLGIALRDRDRGAAEASLRRAMARDPALADAPFQLGNLFRRVGRIADAIAAYEQALVVAPRHAGIHNNLGLALDAAGDSARAVAQWRDALAIDPAHRQAAGNLVHALARDRHYREAAAAFERHLRDRPDVDATLWVDYGICRHHLLDDAGAEASFGKALATAPDDPLVLVNLGSLLAENGDHARAETALARACAADPANLYATSLLASSRQHLCQWGGLEDLHARIRALAARGGADGAPAGGDGALANPFTLLSMPVPPATQLVIARRWARSLLPGRVAPPPARVPRTRRPGDRLRLGYVSADFRTHALAFLATEVWERHDRNRFATCAYSTGPRETSALRARIENAFERFADCADEDPDETARRIAEDGIDLLIDLDGYTTHARSEIFALRPAPVQASWLGYLGSSGADFIDYVITDAFVTPPEAEAFYSERPLRLPNCYCPSDTRRPVAEGAPTRGESGLPDAGFVFCCFNNPYKILPEVFAAWMRILAATPGSVLWLAPGSEIAGANLRTEAAARGVDPARLVFAPQVAPPLHLARQRCADLFLDTLPYNAGTMANDALFVGLPVLTSAGSAMASRVAASQLRAIGLPELVATDLADYEAKAIAIARDPEAHAGLKSRLARNRATHPLFDMARFTRDLEAALEGALRA